MRNTKSIAALALGSLLTGATVHAAGFEKATMWSGKYNGIAGVTASNVEGAEALAFNPAGMISVRDNKKSSLSLNASPIWSKFQGPILVPTTQQSSDTGFSVPFGALMSYGLSEDFAIGLGAYVSGGTKAKYENTDFTPIGVTTLKGTSESSLSVTEFSAGAAYRLLPGLKLGVAYRVLLVKANLSSVLPVAGTPGAAGFTLANLNINDLSDTRWNGFKVGAQYTTEDERFGFGAVWRTPVQFLADGTSSGTLGVAGVPATVPVTGGNATVQGTFPSQITLGGFYTVTPKLIRVAADYVWTQYATNRSLDFTGGVSAPGLGNVNLAALSLPLGWKNQNNLKFGVEYGGIPEYWLRGGYAFTSQVTPNDRARPTFSSPGTGHTFTLGMGRSFMNDSLDVDAAAEYSFASGTVTTADAPKTGTAIGDYSTKGYALHVGTTYRF